MTVKFRNPQNNYEEIASTPISWLWVLLFGPIYWAVRGVWRHCVAHLFFAIVSFGVAHLIYPFFTYKILNNHYRKIGWEEIDN